MEESRRGASRQPRILLTAQLRSRNARMRRGQNSTAGDTTFRTGEGGGTCPLLRGCVMPASLDVSLAGLLWYYLWRGLGRRVKRGRGRRPLYLVCVTGS